MKNTGIYIIVNVQTSKLYIGSSKNIIRRRKEHFQKLKNNTHSNYYLQQSYNKYGKESFKFFFIEEVSEDKLFERETFHIIEKESYKRDKGYNLSIPGIQEDFYPHNSVGILQICKSTGLIIKEYNSVAETARNFNTYEESIRKVLRGDLKSFKGFVFIRKDNYEKDKDYRIQTKGVYIPKGFREPFKGNPVETYNLETSETISVYDNLYDAAEKLNTSRRYLQKVLYGERKSFKGMGIRINKKIQAN